MSAHLHSDGQPEGSKVVPLGGVLNCRPDWRVWPLARALRLRVVVARDADANAMPPAHSGP